MHIDFPKLQFLRERVLHRFRMHACRATEFRSWRNNPIGDHGHDEASFAAGPCCDELGSFVWLAHGGVSGSKNKVQENPDSFWLQM